MSKISDYLGKNLSGEVTVESAVRDYFASDGSVLGKKPQVVIYPRTTDDMRKVTRFAWRLAEKGHNLPLTMRGYGADNTGSATGAGALLVTPAHLQKILELDTKQQKVRVQPGINLRTLQEALATHGLFFPIYPTNLKFSTIGGAIAGGVTGVKSLRYGTMRDWVERLEVILSNGEVIETGRLGRRELNAKKGLQTLEGEIYREIDALIEENAELLTQNSDAGLPNNTGYQLGQVKRPDGSFDLTPLIVGSQGTLAIVTQAILSLAPRPVDTALMVATLPSLENFGEMVEAILAYQPSEFEYIDGAALEWVEEKAGFSPLGTMVKNRPEGVLIIEFDDGDGGRSKNARKVMKMLDGLGVGVELAETWEDKEDIWSVRYSVGALENHFAGDVQPVQFADAVVPIGRIDIFLDKLHALIVKRKIKGYISGRIGAGNLGVTALLDLGKIGDRQAVFGFMRDYHQLAGKLGGSIAGDSGDGRLRQAAARGQYDDAMLGIFEKVKNIFDPKGILNPGVIIGSREADLIADLNVKRQPRFLDYRPRV
ncbi:MAG: FAD-binding oxidoreductase [Candidatus Nomurabacteria bacterium]|jgi:FAD/FMN-containing dehydrogenase|nr:FAD-binding oxidoreductase [Candidatus Nomurabacteria bacterium]